MHHVGAFRNDCGKLQTSLLRNTHQTDLCYFSVTLITAAGTTMKSLSFLSRRSLCSLKLEDLLRKTVYLDWILVFPLTCNNVKYTIHTLILWKSAPISRHLWFCFCTVCKTPLEKLEVWILKVARPADHCWFIFHCWCHFNFNVILMSVSSPVPPLHLSVLEQIMGGKVKCLEF